MSPDRKAVPTACLPPRSLSRPLPPCPPRPPPVPPASLQPNAVLGTLCWLFLPAESHAMAFFSCRGPSQSPRAPSAYSPCAIHRNSPGRDVPAWKAEAAECSRAARDLLVSSDTPVCMYRRVRAYLCVPANTLTRCVSACAPIRRDGLDPTDGTRCRRASSGCRLPFPRFPL